MMQASAKSRNIPVYIDDAIVPITIIHNMIRSPDTHAQKVMQPPPTSLAAVPILSSRPPLGCGGTFGKSSISANEVSPVNAGVHLI